MPNRIIKESTFTSDRISQLSDFEFRLWVGLITQADDAGRGDARPAIIKGRIFALRERTTLKDIDAALQALAAAGCVSLYTVGGKPYFQFPNWAKHQRVRDAKPKYPAMENADSPQLAATRGEAPPKSNPIQSEPNPNPNEKEIAHTRGEFGWVKLTDAQYEKLVKDLGKDEADRCIAYIDESAQQTGNKNKWKDWNLTIRKCSREKWGLSRASVYSQQEPTRPYSPPPDASKREKPKTFIPEWAD